MDIPTTPPAELARKHIDRGLVLLKKKRYEQAKAMFYQADQLDPQNPEIYGLITSASKKNFDYDEAILYYQKVASITPNNYMAYGNIGYITKKLKRYDAAINAFQKVLTINPNEYRAIDDLASVYFTTGDYNNCLIYLNKFEAVMANEDPDYMTDKTKMKLKKRRRVHLGFRKTIAEQQSL